MTTHDWLAVLVGVYSFTLLVLVPIWMWFDAKKSRYRVSDNK